jgi:lipopolysaccharide export system protein LptA
MKVFILSVYYILSLSVFPALAQGFNFASQNTKAPIEVYADNGIEWVQDKKSFVAKGNARAARGDVVVRADTLTAHYRDKKEGGTELYKLEANGNVRITSPDSTVYGEYGVYDIDSASLILKGKNLKLNTANDEVTASDSLEYWEGKKQAIAKGNAVAGREGRRIRADVITSILAPDANGKMAMKQANANGNVKIATTNEIAYGDAGTYIIDTGIATLRGNVRVERNQNQLNGAYAEVNLKTGVSRLFSTPPGTTAAEGQRVRGVFMPERGGR